MIPVPDSSLLHRPLEYLRFLRLRIIFSDQVCIPAYLLVIKIQNIILDMWRGFMHCYFKITGLFFQFCVRFRCTKFKVLHYILTRVCVGEKIVGFSFFTVSTCLKISYITYYYIFHLHETRNSTELLSVSPSTFEAMHV